MSGMQHSKSLSYILNLYMKNKKKTKGWLGPKLERRDKSKILFQRNCQASLDKKKKKITQCIKVHLSNEYQNLYLVNLFFKLSLDSRWSAGNREVIFYINNHEEND